LFLLEFFFLSAVSAAFPALPASVALLMVTSQTTHNLLATLWRRCYCDLRQLSTDRQNAKNEHSVNTLSPPFTTFDGGEHNNWTAHLGCTCRRWAGTYLRSSCEDRYIWSRWR